MEITGTELLVENKRALGEAKKEALPGRKGFPHKRCQ